MKKVHIIARGMKRLGLTPKVDVSERQRPYWVDSGVYGVEVIISDGVYTLHPTQDQPGKTKYEVCDNATYVLIAKRASGEWNLIYAHFPSSEVDTVKLVPALRVFNKADHLELHQKREDFFNEILP
jgi:hypothetical protein